MDSVTELTPPAGARILIIQAIKRTIRFTLDGTVPTISRLLADEDHTIDIVPGTILKFIGEMAGGSIEFQWGA